MAFAPPVSLQIWRGINHSPRGGDPEPAIPYRRVGTYNYPMSKPPASTGSRIIADDRYSCLRAIKMLRRIANMIRPEPKREPLPERSPGYEPPVVARTVAVSG